MSAILIRMNGILIPVRYTEINFTAFAMLGKSFCPRIKNIKEQWLYKINEEKDYGSLNRLLKGARAHH